MRFETSQRIVSRSFLGALGAAVLFVAAHAALIRAGRDTSWGAALDVALEDKAATRLIHSCWISFAKTGKPQCEGAPDWPRYSPESDQLMELGLNPKVLTGYRKAQLDAQEKAMNEVIDDTRKSVEDLVRQLTSP